MIEVTVDIAALSKLIDDLGEGFDDEVVEAMAQEILDGADQLVPVDTGALKESGHVDGSPALGFGLGLDTSESSPAWQVRGGADCGECVVREGGSLAGGVPVGGVGPVDSPSDLGNCRVVRRRLVSVLNVRGTDGGAVQTDGSGGKSGRGAVR